MLHVTFQQWQRQQQKRSKTIEIKFDFNFCAGDVRQNINDNV